MCKKTTADSSNFNLSGEESEKADANDMAVGINRLSVSF